MEAQKEQLLQELKSYEAFLDSTGRRIARVRKIGEELYALGGVPLMDATVDQVDDSIEYVWDGIGDFEIRVHRDKRNAPGIVGNWGTSNMKRPQTKEDPIGFVRFFLSSQKDMQWLKDNITYDGKPSGNDEYGFMNCRNSIEQLEQMGILVRTEGEGHPDLLL